MAGHMAMLADPDFCELAQVIGRASLGANQKQIWHLTKLYWFTVEVTDQLQVARRFMLRLCTKLRWSDARVRISFIYATFDLKQTGHLSARS